MGPARPLDAPDLLLRPGTSDKIRAITASYVGVLFFAGLVFLGAWRIVYWHGFLYLALALFGTTLSHALVRSGSTITVDRAREAHRGQDWDRRLLAVSLLVTVVTFLTAGMDSGRFGWTGEVPVAMTVTGVGLMLLGQVLFALAKRENPFFSSTVRIQAERGHRVCDSGLYRVVRHPGYLGMLASLVAFPLVMNSYWAFVPAGVGAVLIVVRTVLEDRFLIRELPGYVDYARRTRSKLLPGVF
jgi:protein-S-isoprenylcysteine O-methyltransferase Ste14